MGYYVELNYSNCDYMSIKEDFVKESFDGINF